MRNKGLVVLALLALLGASEAAKPMAQYTNVSLPVTEKEVQAKRGSDVGSFGTVCGIIYAYPENLTIGGRVTWNEVKVFDFRITNGKVCASEKKLIKLVELIPPLAPFKKVISKVRRLYGKLPEVMSLCIRLHDAVWSGKTHKACAAIDMKLICWKGKCQWQGTHELGCFTIGWSTPQIGLDSQTRGTT